MVLGETVFKNQIFLQKTSPSVSNLFYDKAVCLTALVILGLLREPIPVPTSDNGSKSLLVLAKSYVLP